MTSKKPNGAVVVNAYWRGGDEGALEIARRLSERGYPCPLIRTDDLFMRLDGGAKGDIPLDFAVFLDKDYSIARLLESEGVRLFNAADAIRLSDDKMLTHISLLAHSVPQPKTIPSPLFFAGEEKGDFVRKVIKELGFPLVVKKCFGAFGKEVYLAKNENELLALRKRLLPEPHLYQEYVECGASDLRVIVIAGQAVAAMRRRAAAKGEFRANAELGGSGERIELTKEIKELAEKAASALGLFYAGVDLVEKDGNYLLVEVNSNAHFKLIKKVTGVDVAAIYAEKIEKELLKN